jgi:hypothetical protein
MLMFTGTAEEYIVYAMRLFLEGYSLFLVHYALFLDDF